MLNWLAKLAKELGEDAVADRYWRDHDEVITAAYDKARAAGLTEHEALEAATKAGIEHAV
jgi:hypothetical protein